MKFPIGVIAAFAVNHRKKFPDREIILDIVDLIVILSRSVKIMLKRTLTPADIGAVIRTTRKVQNLRQDELAGAAGVGLRFIVELEAGKPTAQLGKTLLVLQALGCSFEIAAPQEHKTGPAS